MLEQRQLLSGGAELPQDGYRTSVAFPDPYGITSDGANLYVTEMFNNTIRKIGIVSGEATTLTGVAGSSGSNDSTDSIALFSMPLGITTDGTKLYVTDMLNNTIRQIAIATAKVTTLEGSAGNDGIGSAARFNQPRGLFLKGSDLYVTDGTNLYVADIYNNAIRQIVIATGALTTLASSDFTVDLTDGTVSSTLLISPTNITSDGMKLYVSDYANNNIRKVVIAIGVVTTVAGSAESSGSTDGSASVALFDGPGGITTDGTSLYVLESNNKIRSIR